MNLHRCLSLVLSCLFVAVVTALGEPASQKTIRDATEYNAYMAAFNTAAPADKALALEAFTKAYPNSVVQADAVQLAMAAYQQAGDAPAVERMARRLLELQPDNVRALAIRTALLRGRATQGDTEALSELQVVTARGLRALAGWTDPEGMSAEEFTMVRRKTAAVLHGGAAFAALQAKKYSEAAAEYREALARAPDDLQDVYQLAIAELQVQPPDVRGFWHVARACALAKAAGNTAGEKGIADYGRKSYRHFHGSDDGWDELRAQAAQAPEPPEGFAVKPAPTPAELAVLAVLQHDPAELSLSDWEYVLSYRDATPANQAAAEKVWQHILSKQKGDTGRLQFTVQVISASPDGIEAAVTDDNQKAGMADMHIVPTKTPESLPEAGAILTVTGRLTGYTPNPFRFTLENAEIEAPPAKAKGD